MSKAAKEPESRVAFRVAPELVQRAQSVVRAVRENPSDRASVDELITVILELTDQGLDYYFLEPLRRISVGTVSMTTARVGVAAAGRGLPAIVRRVIASLDHEQLRQLADFLEGLLIPDGQSAE